MSKAVMISIQPKWCELIANGKKTIEIRKTRPKLEPPFKCYIYCTRVKHKKAFHTYINSGYGRENFGVIGHWRSGKEIVDVNAHLPAYRYNAYLAESKVIGEFVCYEVESIDVPYPAYSDKLDKRIIEQSQVPYYALHKYAYHDTIYGWHISGLVIYDKPKELSEFYRECAGVDDTGLCYECAKAVGDEFSCSMNYELHLTRPPQSWCYVEETHNAN